MKATDVLREILYPLTDMATILAMLFFWLIYSFLKLLPAALGVIGLVIAVFILVIVAAAFLRFLTYLLEARANGRQSPVPTEEFFSPLSNTWSLAPTILAAVLIWGGLWISNYGLFLLSLYGLVIVFVFPATLAILAITHSPAESLNPAAVLRMMRVCGPSYVAAPLSIVVLTALFSWLGSVGVPQAFLDFGMIYQSALMFSLMGGVLYLNDVAAEVDIGSPLTATAEEVANDLVKKRQKVASHAYGFISRGNREGGFAHILDWIQKEPDVDAASSWFFAEMMKWESNDAAQYFAQIYLAHLLHHEQDAKALKLISTCLYTNPVWKPNPEDRPHVLTLVEKHQRSDLLKQLRN